MENKIEQATGVIVKSDQTGRTRHIPQYNREVLAAFESSSLRVPVFARKCGIKYPTLAAWIAAWKRGDQAASRQNTPALLNAGLHHPLAHQRLKSNYSAGPSLAHRMPSRSVISPEPAANFQSFPNHKS